MVLWATLNRVVDDAQLTKLTQGGLAADTLKTIADNAGAINDMLTGNLLGNINPAEIVNAKVFMENQRAAKIAVSFSDEMFDVSENLKKYGGNAYNIKINSGQRNNMGSMRQAVDQMWSDFYRDPANKAMPKEHVLERMEAFYKSVEESGLRYADSTHTGPVIVTMLRKIGYEGRIRLVEKQGQAFVVIGDDANAFVIDGWTNKYYPLDNFNKKFTGYVEDIPSQDYPHARAVEMNFADSAESWDQDASIKFDLQMTKDDCLPLDVESYRSPEVDEFAKAVNDFAMNGNSVMFGGGKDLNLEDFNSAHLINERAASGSGKAKAKDLSKEFGNIPATEKFYNSKAFEPIRIKLMEKLGSSYKPSRIKELLGEYDNMIKKKANVFNGINAEKLESYLAHDATESPAQREWMTLNGWKEKFNRYAGKPVRNYWTDKPKMMPSGEPSPTAQGAIKIYRSMGQGEARAILAAGNLGPMKGHLGDFKQASDYFKKHDDQVLMEITLNVGAQERLFSPEYIAIQHQGDVPGYMHGAITAKYPGADIPKANLAEGEARGYIGVKSEGGGSMFSFKIKEGDGIAKGKFISLVDKITVISGPPDLVKMEMPLA